ncbi:MAG: glutamyl-tRNA reductase [Armatimonadetes bacterium]|nr:glutamyl-tRNA reductase [Armatimonadota bacterium]
MHLQLTGTSHKSAPVEVREKLAFGKHQFADSFRLLRSRYGVRECVILSTCNRIEIYTGSEQPLRETIELFLQEFHNLPASAISHCLFHRSNDQAVRHLLGVSAGLDSMIVGEAQILGQVSEAHRLAQEHKAVGPILDRLFRQALSTGKRARTETEINRGAVSISHAAVELARQIFGDLTGRRALLIGAGEMSEITARLLASGGVGKILVASRTRERSEELAGQFGGEAMAYEDFPKAMVSADIVICSTSAPHAIIRHQDVRQVVHARRARPLFIIDMAVPRDVEAEVGDLDNVFLFNIDDLRGVVEKNLAERNKEIGKVEAIIQEEIERFIGWFRSLEVVPVLTELNRKLEAIRRAEIEMSARKLAHLSEKDRQTVEIVTQGIIKRILKHPMAHLKAEAQSGNGHAHLETLRALFDLEQYSETADEPVPDEDILREAPA